MGSREQTIEVDEERLVETFCSLARVDSPSGDEEAISKEVAQRLRDLGCDVTTDSTRNVIGRLEGAAEAEPIILSAHLDTVEPGRGVQPHLKDGVIRSDGTTVLGADDKAGVAAILEALQAVRANGRPMRPVEVVFTVEEEVGLLGAYALDTSTLRSSVAVVLDSAGQVGTIINKAPEHDRIDATIVGRAAHAGVAPETGISAIAVASQAIAAMRLGRLDSETTANIGQIEGGTAMNVVPERVTVTGEARSHDPAKVAVQMRHMVSALEEAAEEAGARAEVEVSVVYRTFSIPEDHSLVQLLAAAIRRTGLEPTMHATGGGSDASVFNERGIATVNLGVGYESIHSTDEHIAVAELTRLARVLVALLVP
ncbi:MAG: peptidase M20 [Dehalococcoidia bacterium]|nr:peptidase M20 [Dehalococcoidia bacterium]